MDILNFRCTYTTKFILPLLFKERIPHTKVLNENFINAYIADLEKKENDDKIHLLFSDYPSIALTNLLPEPVTEYENNRGYVFVYDISEEYHEDYWNFLTGKYSQFSENTKQNIIDFWGVEEDSLLYGVLYKKGDKIVKYCKDHLKVDLTKSMPSVEWWSAPKIDREIIGLAKN